MGLALRRHLALTLVLAACAAACQALGLPGGPGAARLCEDVYSDARCEAMRTVAAERLGIADTDITKLEIAPEPTPRADGILQNTGGGRPVDVLAHTATGVRRTSMCHGLPIGPACTHEQVLTIHSPIGGGYHDVPCAGEPPAGCATPLPRLEREAVAAAQALTIDRRTIPVPGPGRHEIVLGQARLPNGVLTESRAALADPWPDGLSVSSEGIRLEVRSLVPGRPAFRNSYEHGWWPGTEAVEVVLVFEARRADPGAALEIVDLVVR